LESNTKEEEEMIGKKLLAIAVTYLLLRYIRNVYRIFQVLKKRRALIQTFAGREYIPDEKIVSKEEFEEGLKSLEQMVLFFFFFLIILF